MNRKTNSRGFPFLYISSQHHVLSLLAAVSDMLHKEPAGLFCHLLHRLFHGSDGGMDERAERRARHAAL